MDELFAPDVRPWNAHKIVMSRTVNLPPAQVGNGTDPKSIEERRETA